MADHEQNPREVTAQVGQLIDGRYHVDGLIGDGGMGSVYRAIHVTLRKQVAIKLLHRELADHPGFAERFEREALAAGRIDHPNCVGVSDFGRLENGTLYLVMELALGRTLSELLAEHGRLPVSRALHIARHALRALDHAHRASIVHRDVKPDNIILVDHKGDRDFAKLLDFGIAKLVGEAASETKNAHLTQVGTTVGTPKYMPPEQAFGKEVDGRSDLYSLSVVLYMMLAGRAPFVAEEIIDLLMMHASQPPPPFSETAPDANIPPAVEAMVMRGLAKKREDRPESAAAYLEVLEDALDEIAVRRSRDGGAPKEFSEPTPSPSLAFDPTSNATPVPRPVPTPMATLSLQSFRPTEWLHRVTPLQWAVGIGGLLLFIIIVATAAGSGDVAEEPAPGLEPPNLGVGEFLEDTASSLSGQPSKRALELRKLNKEGRYRDVIEKAQGGELDGHAQLELGHAYFGTDQPAQGIASYLKALEASPELRSNTSVMNRARALLTDEQVETRLAAAELLARFAFDDKGRAALVALAGDNRDLESRQRARALAIELGLRDDINLVRSYALDLVQDSPCEERRKALLALGDLGDPRALHVIKRSRHRSRGGLLGIGAKNTNRCLKTDADRIIEELSEKVSD